MDFTQYKDNFFKNDALMKEKFGIIKDYVEPLFYEVCGEDEDTQKKILSYLKNIETLKQPSEEKIKYFLRNNGVDYKNRAEQNTDIALYKKFYAIKDFIFLSADIKECFVPKGITFDNVQDIKSCAYSIKPNSPLKRFFNTVNIAGNTSFIVDNGKKILCCSYIAELKEQSIVEDWAYSFASRMGMPINDSFKEFAPLTQIMHMWNLVSENELRRQYIHSTQKSPFTEATYEFDNRLTAFLRTFVYDKYNMNDKVFDINHFKADKISKNLENLVKFCNENLVKYNMEYPNKMGVNVSFESQKSGLLNPNDYVKIMYPYTIDNGREKNIFTQGLKGNFKTLAIDWEIEKDAKSEDILSTSKEDIISKEWKDF